MVAHVLLDRLDRVRETGPGTWRARCPAHDGKSQTLSVRETDTGVVLIHCFASCGVADVLAAVGLSVSDLFPERLPDRRFARSRSLMPAREALACIDHEVIVAHLIIADVLEQKAVDAEQWERFALCESRISAARNLSCPARAETANA